MPTTSHVTMPMASGKNLAGADFILPHHLTHEVNLLIIGCYPWQQTIQDAWVRHTSAIRARYQDFDVYECNLTPDKAVDWVEDRRFEQLHGNASYAQRRKVIALYTPRSRFLQDLRIANDRTVHVLLVDRRGDILWRTQGHPGADKIRQLTNAVHYRLVVEGV